MTAAHRTRPALEVVPAPAESTQTLTADDGRADTVIEAFSAEHQLIGSLLWLGVDAAAPLLELVPDTAIYRPVSRWAWELIRRVVNAGDTPTPPTVLAAGRRHAAGDALDPHQPPTAGQQRELALYLFDAYSEVISPAAAAPTYARHVLEDAYRRAFDACGIRMQQLAASGGADRHDLTSAFAAIRDELADLWRRTEAAA
jgi:replicative DNA helicase